MSHHIMLALQKANEQKKRKRNYCRKNVAFEIIWRNIFTSSYFPIGGILCVCMKKMSYSFLYKWNGYYSNDMQFHENKRIHSERVSNFSTLQSDFPCDVTFRYVAQSSSKKQHICFVWRLCVSWLWIQNAFKRLHT